MTKYNTKELEKTIRLLYDNADKEIVAFLKAQEKLRTSLYQEIANIMLTYTIENDVMNMTKEEQAKEINKMTKFIKEYSESEATEQIVLITNLLASTVNSVYSYYRYNANKKVIQELIDKHYKGKHFSSRVWENEEEVAKHIKKKVEDFVRGKGSVNTIKNDIKRVFNSSDYNAKRLAYTEISRVQEHAFQRFAQEVGVTRVVYNAKLDSKTCEDCKLYDLKEYDIEDAPSLPRHPLCRCYYEIADDIEDLELEQVEETVGVNREDAPKVRERVRLRNWEGTREEYDQYIEEYRKEKEELNKYVKDTLEKDKNKPRQYTDIKVAKAKLEELGLKHVDLTEIDSLFYDDIIKAVEINSNKFPVLKDRLEFIGTEKSYQDYSKTILRKRNIKDYMKETGVSLEEATKYIDDNMILGEIIDDDFLMEATNGIKFSKNFKNYDYVVEQEYFNFLDGFRVQGDGSMLTSFTHEIGHNLDKYLTEKGIGTKEILDEILTKYPNTNISEYALLNRKEYFAELYADMMLSKNPSQEAKLLEKLLEGALK